MSTPTEELEEEFRFMITQVASGLEKAECERIVYLKGLPKDTCYPNQEKHDVKLFTLVTLEARGFMSPLNPDPLRTLLVRIDRQNLTRHIDDYLSKRMPLMKKIEKERKKSMKRQKNKKGDNTEQQQHQLGPDSEELFAMKAKSSTKEQLKRLQTLTLSYIARLMQNAQALHAVIHDDDSTESFQQQKEEACHAVVKETEKFDRRFRKVLSAAGISSSKDSSSSEESGVGICDERKNSDLPMPHRKHYTHQLHTPKMEQGNRQPNSIAYKPISGGVPVILSGTVPLVGLPQPTKTFHQKPVTGQLHTGSDTTPKASRRNGTSHKRPPPLPPPKPKHAHEHKSNAVTHSSPVEPNSNQGSGDSGVYITHSLPSLLDDSDDQDQKLYPDQGPHYENTSFENEYEPVEYDDNSTAASGPTNNVYEHVEFVGSSKGVHLKPLRARASSMDDTLYSH